MDLREDAIVGITPSGIETEQGSREIDVIVFATGFHALTGALTAVGIRGRDGMSLRDEWRAGPRTWLSLCVAGFPNLFTITGPGSPSVLTTMFTSIEQHVDWVVDLLTTMRAEQRRVCEADAAAQDTWVDHVREVAERSLFVHGKSWYLGANVPGKLRVFLPYVGGAHRYRQICDAVAAADYTGLTFDGVGADSGGFTDLIRHTGKEPAAVASGDAE